MLLIILIPLIAQAGIKTNYSKYSKIKNDVKITGKEVARNILDRNGLNNVEIRCVNGDLTDHYDSRNKTVSLSSNIYNGTSIASIAVAAHECGHAIQDKQEYFFLKLRTFLVPIVNISSRISTIFLIIGFGAELLNIVNIGIILLLVGLLFQIVTLPVEFNASSRALKELQKLKYVNNKSFKGTKKVLKSAALTYVAGFISEALQIFRLILISRDNN